MCYNTHVLAVVVPYLLVPFAALALLCAGALLARKVRTCAIWTLPRGVLARIVQPWLANRGSLGDEDAWMKANADDHAWNVCAIDCSTTPRKFWYWDEASGIPIWTSKTKGATSWPNE